MGEIIPSESLSHVTYTGINSMHSQKTKPPYIRSARKNRTRNKRKKERKKKKKKKAEEEDRRKSPEKIKKNEPLEKLKSTESLKRERAYNPPPPLAKKRKKEIYQIAKNGTPKDRKAKEQARAEKATN